MVAGGLLQQWLRKLKDQKICNFLFSERVRRQLSYFAFIELFGQTPAVRYPEIS
jgi:hypothetical protein